MFVAGTSIDVYVPTSYLDELLSKSPLWLFFLLGCICVPVFEEFTFRYWAKVTVASKVISTVLIYISFYLVFAMRFNYWLLLISLVVLTIFIIFLFCLKKGIGAL